MAQKGELIVGEIIESNYLDSPEGQELLDQEKLMVRQKRRDGVLPQLRKTYSPESTGQLPLTGEPLTST